MAEGWEPKGERVERTRYFALRDEGGAYKGILEVHEDVTDASALEGAQSLPGW